MLTKSIVWSPSRVRMLNECPRRYVHFHVVGSGGWPGGPRSKVPKVAHAWQLGNRRNQNVNLVRVIIYYLFWQCGIFYFSFYL